MPQKSYRVIQWVTGHIGTIAVRHFAENPVFDLVGLLVTNPEKVGKDAGAIVGIDDTGVIATSDVDEIVGLDADCIFYAPMYGEVDVEHPDGCFVHPGYDWTAMGAINAIPDVRDSSPGWITNLDLGMVQPRGLVR